MEGLLHGNRAATVLVVMLMACGGRQATGVRRKPASEATAEAQALARGCQLGDGAACHDLALAGADRRGALLARACRLGNLESCRLVARAWRRAGATMKARALWSGACDRGDAPSCLELGRDAAGPVLPARAQADAAFGAACDLGELEGCSALGVNDGRPDLRDRVLIASRMHGQHGRVYTCIGPEAEGTVTLTVTVGREGRVESILTEVGGPEVAACLRDAFAGLEFGPAMRRQTFRYPYDRLRSERTEERP